MIENLETLKPSEVHQRVHEIADSGYRFVTMSSVNNPDGTVDVFYHFDKDYQMLNVKTTVTREETLESVSNVYLVAAFPENEIGELFGVKFSGVAIDFGGRFVHSVDSPESPFGAGIIIERKEGGKNG